jgi:hypothetical protein
VESSFTYDDIRSQLLNCWFRLTGTRAVTLAFEVWIAADWHADLTPEMAADFAVLEAGLGVETPEMEAVA